jgi:predicted AAA+ superfamily ATPase
MSVILTGSDSVIIRSAMKRFAGRRGPADRTDFIFHPLSFKEYILLRDPGSKQILSKIMKTSLQEQVAGYPEKHAELTRYLEGYMLHGGYLPAISAYLTGNTIPGSVYNIYTEWIIGDILKYNKSENYLHEVLKGILSSYSSQVSWNSLAKHLSIDHHKTVSDYCQILSSVHVLYILEALEEHKLAGAPKKNKKMYFRDPFIYHAASSYIDGRIPYESLEKKIKDPAYASYLAETVVIDHCQRHAKTFYIKGNKGEVDAAIIRGRRFYPVEVKWTKQLRVEELKQILTYKNGFVLTPRAEHGAIGNLTVIPLIRFLLSDIGCL